MGNLTDEIAPDGVVTHYTYDPLSRLAAVTLNYRPAFTPDHETNVTYRYRYDANGNLVALVNPLGHTTTFDYDALDRLIGETNPVSSTWRYAYDAVGNLVTRTDANGDVTRYHYDADDLLVRVDYVGSNDDLAFAYDAVHNLTRMTDTVGVTTWQYDALDRITQVSDALGRILAYEYDPEGNRTALVYPEGGRVQYEYDAANRLTRVTAPTGLVTRFERDAVGNLVRQLNPNGTVVEATYDQADRLLRLVNRRDSGEIIAAFEYTLNEVGLRTAMRATYGWRQPAVVEEQYTYDPLRRLVRVTNDAGFDETYAYDAASNRVRWQANDDVTTQRPRDGFTVTYIYDAADRLVQAERIGAQPNDHQTFTYAYDANGNRVNVEWNGPPGPGTQGWTYTYDRENRLVEAQAYQISGGNRIAREVMRFAYDGLGRRLAVEYDPKTGNGGVKRTEYAYDGLDPIAEYDRWNGQRREYYRGGVEAFSPVPMLLAMRRFPAETDGQTYWYHLDGRGNVAGLTKHQGQSTHNYRYDAYGRLIPARGNFTDPHNHYTLTGKEWDEATGLYYFGARYYDPSAGLWLTPDPFRGALAVPLSLHRYAFVHANPVNWVDAYGYFLETLADIYFTYKSAKEFVKKPSLKNALLLGIDAAGIILPGSTGAARRVLTKIPKSEKIIKFASKLTKPFQKIKKSTTKIVPKKITKYLKKFKSNIKRKIASKTGRVFEKAALWKLGLKKYKGPKLSINGKKFIPDAVEKSLNKNIKKIIEVKANLFTTLSKSKNSNIVKAIEYSKKYGVDISLVIAPWTKISAPLRKELKKANVKVIRLFEKEYTFAMFANTTRQLLRSIQLYSQPPNTTQNFIKQPVCKISK